MYQHIQMESMSYEQVDLLGIQVSGLPLCSLLDAENNVPIIIDRLPINLDMPGALVHKAFIQTSKCMTSQTGSG
jgi:hypothetical protein